MDASVIIALIGLATSLGGYLAGYRTRRAQAASVEMHNMRAALKTWQEIVDHQTGEIAALRSEIIGLKNEILNVERLYRERLENSANLRTLRSLKSLKSLKNQ